MAKEPCSECGGSGRVEVNRDRHIESTTSCRHCKGSGNEPKKSQNSITDKDLSKMLRKNERNTR